MPPGRRKRKLDTGPIEQSSKSTDRKTELFDEMSRLLDLHDDRTRLLFHLDKFVSLVYFDPVEAKKDTSQMFENWRLPYDLWETTAASQPSRMARNKVYRVHEAFKAYMREKSAFLAEDQKPVSESETVDREVPAKRRKKRGRPPSAKKQNSIRGKRQKRSPSISTYSDSSSGDEILEENGVLMSSPEIEEEDLPPARKLSLRLKTPPPLITNPRHVTDPKFGGDLDALLSTYKSLADEDIDLDLWKKRIATQAEIVHKVVAARNSGLLDELEKLGTWNESSNMKFVDPIRSVTHHDNLVAQAAHLGKFGINLRRSLMSNTKKIAYAIEQYFRRLAGAEEKERKDHERAMRQLARRIGAEVMKKWKLAEKVVLQRRQFAQEEENRLKGKEVLNQILEQSAQLLEQRIGSYAPEDDTDAQLSTDPNIADDRLSSSSEDESSNSDDLLTVEELQRKYANLPQVSFGDSDDESSASNIFDDDQSERHTVASGSISRDEGLDDENPNVDSESSKLLSTEFSTEESEEDDNDEDDVQPDLLSSLIGSKLDSQDEDVSDLDQDLESLQTKDSGSEISCKEMEEKSQITVDESNDDDSSELVKSHQLMKEETRTGKLNKVGQPFLLRGTLREYQRDGLDWLVGLYNSQSNGILADEMGLGKTIQTIALLAYLACEKGIWGPHLIVVPTSVMLNWEMEFKRFCPGFKVLTYYGNPQQRKEKRRGWNNEESWNVCITSYQLVIQDQVAFRRKKWRYMILDEAHNIKNFRSQRWQALLNFSSERRLLLTGTPLQNNLVELWSLLYFLMPSTKKTQSMPDGFATLEDFQEWFVKPVDQMVEEGEEANEETHATIAKLHQVLRPYLLRRLKVDVETQMPGKFDHIVYCRLSKRQRYLYDEFMSRAATKAHLASGNFMSILNCLMQLRKVCNHPDLFEVRPIVTSLALEHSVAHRYTALARKFSVLPPPSWDVVDLEELNLHYISREKNSKWAALTTRQTRANKELALWLAEYAPETVYIPMDLATLDGCQSYAAYAKRFAEAERRQHMIYLNMFRTKRVPIYGRDLHELVQMPSRIFPGNLERARRHDHGYDWLRLTAIDNLVLSIPDREEQLKEVITRYCFVTPPVVCLDQPILCVGPLASASDFETVRRDPTFHDSQVRLSIAFPDKRLLQYDCGKLQKLAILLRDLIAQGHRCLIFTQMTRVLDILEQFLNIHGWRYLRLDGATRVEQRQVLTERFNKDSSIPVFILSTRSGGLGINLTGADTVIFYDSDWNPAMDKQCQDRCHRIGQTRDVHIYRLVSEYTIESNILRRATQKTILDNVVIQEGDFTTDYFNKLSVRDLLGDAVGPGNQVEELHELGQNFEALAQAEDAEDTVAANMAINEARLDAEEFCDRAATAPADGAAHASASASDAAAASTAPTAPAPLETRSEYTPELEAAAMGVVHAEKQIGHVDDYMISLIERGYLEQD